MATANDKNSNGGGPTKSEYRMPKTSNSRTASNNRDTDRSAGQSRVAAASGRAGNGNGANWWDDLGRRDRKDQPMRDAANLHRMADKIWTPESNVSAGPSRSRAAKQGVAESRNGNGSPRSTSKAPAKAPATKTPATKTATRGR
jgi:hypothetical protein